MENHSRLLKWLLVLPLRYCGRSYAARHCEVAYVYVRVVPRRAFNADVDVTAKIVWAKQQF